MTLSLFHRFTATCHPLTHFDVHLLAPGWLIVEWGNWRLEFDHDPGGWLTRLLARLVDTVEPLPL